jgi:hypothetical protein
VATKIFSENSFAYAATLRGAMASTDFANVSPARLTRHRQQSKTAHLEARKERRVRVIKAWKS